MDSFIKHLCSTYRKAKFHADITAATLNASEAGVDMGAIVEALEAYTLRLRHAYDYATAKKAAA
jgi:hypothetical protein